MVLSNASTHKILKYFVENLNLAICGSLLTYKLLIISYKIKTWLSVAICGSLQRIDIQNDEILRTKLKFGSRQRIDIQNY